MSDEPTLAAAGGGLIQRTIAAGRYELEEFVGSGASKAAFRARDTVLDRTVALAFLKVPIAGNHELERFQREVRAMGRVGDHSNVVAIYDIGEELGRTYIVSQYVPGGSVAARLRESDERRLPIAEAVAIGVGVAQALQAAHQAGIVHRDVKPGNIWLAADGTALLGDFGIAVLHGTAGAGETEIGFGTEPYMSPEQITGAPVDGASDLYSLGATLYELVCGRPPFEGPLIAHQHLHAAPPLASRERADVPGALEALIAALLAKDPGQRPPSAGDVVEALKAILAPRAHGALVAGDDFVGRDGLLTRFARLVDDAVAGHGQLVLLSGEPGVGKTRTAEEVTRYADLRGMQVMWGRCHEGDGAPAYWPWVHALRSYVEERDPEALAAELGGGAARIAQAVRPVRERLPDLPQPAELTPEDARFELMEGLSAFLCRIAEHRPVALVVDDLQWADRPSLLVLDFLARELKSAHILVIGIYRQERRPPDHPLTRFLGDLSAAQVPAPIPLGGLAEQEVAVLVEQIAGFVPDPRLVAAIHERTDGNAFYVHEVVQLLAANDSLRTGDRRVIAELPLPSGVRDAVRRRLEQRSPQCRRMLETAAVIGDEFKFDVLARVVGAPAAQVIEHVDEGMAADLLRSGESKGRYRFAHALIRETVYEELSHGERLRSHLAIALALEAIADITGDVDIDQLAHHFYAASELGAADKAVTYCQRAGAHAEASLAFEDAVDFRVRALKAHALGGAGGQARRCTLLLELGDAHLLAGEFGDGRECLREAAEIASRLNLVEELAHAALGMSEWHQYGVIDHDAIAVLEATLRALPDDDSVLTARLAGQLATRLSHRTDAERRGELSRHAVEMARRLGDDHALSTALTHRIFAIRDPSCLAEQMQAADESAQLADRHEEHTAGFWAHVCRFTCRLELGDLMAADTALAAAARSASASRQPYYRWYTAMLQSTRRLVEGDCERGEQLALEALRLRELHDPGAREVFVAQAFALAAQRGRLAELDVDELAELAAEYHSVPAWRAMLARVHVAAGRRAEGLAVYNQDGLDDFAAIRGGDDSLTALALLAETCAALGDIDHAGALAALLEPWSSRSVVFNYGWAFHGSVERPLGLLAAVRGRHDEAIARFELALHTDERTGAWAWAAHDTALLAGALTARAAPGDPARAAERLKRAQEAARRLGIAALPATPPSPAAGNGLSPAPEVV